MTPAIIEHDAVGDIAGEPDPWVTMIIVMPASGRPRIHAEHLADPFRVERRVGRRTASPAAIPRAPWRSPHAVAGHQTMRSADGRLVGRADAGEQCPQGCRARLLRRLAINLDRRLDSVFQSGQVLEQIELLNTMPDCRRGAGLRQLAAPAGTRRPAIALVGPTWCAVDRDLAPIERLQMVDNSTNSVPCPTRSAHHDDHSPRFTVRSMPFRISWSP